MMMMLRKDRYAGCGSAFRKLPGPALMAGMMAVCVYAVGEPVTLSFHDSVLVNDTVFTLGDIAGLSGGDASVRAALSSIVAGTSAPPGYARFIATVDYVAGLLTKEVPGAQVVFAGAKRPLVKTDYRPVRIADHQSLLKRFMTDSIGWKPGAWQMTVENESDSCKVLDAPYEVSFGGLNNRYPKGNTSLTMVLRQGTRTWHMPIRCRFAVTVPVVVARIPIGRGAVITADMYEIRTMDITRFAPSACMAAEMVLGLKAARSIEAGAILYDRLLSRIPAVEKGDAVSIIITRGRISVAVTGTAREQGAIGDRIWVENGTTRKLIRVQIKEKGLVVPLQGGVSI